MDLIFGILNFGIDERVSQRICMSFLEICKELSLSLCVAIALPITTNMGVKLFTQSLSATHDADEMIQKSDTESEAPKSPAVNPFAQKVSYYSLLCVGIVAIVIGALVRIPSVTVGLVLGGLFNVWGASFFYEQSPVFDFIISVTVLAFILAMIFIRHKK